MECGPGSRYVGFLPDAPLLFGGWFCKPYPLPGFVHGDEEVVGTGAAGVFPLFVRVADRCLGVWGERRPVEADLQQDYYQRLATGQLGGSVSVEPTDIATGRADVIVTFGTLRYLTEIKRELSNSTRAKLEDKYIRQAAEYGNTNVPFGQLLVLDLTPHPYGAPRVDESVWLARHRPPGTTTERLVIVGAVTGNRPAPHDLSPDR